MTTVTPNGAIIEDTSGPSRVRRFTAGERLLDVENLVTSFYTRDGVVRAVHCREGDLVQPGHVLLDLD